MGLGNGCGLVIIIVDYGKGKRIKEKNVDGILASFPNQAGTVWKECSDWKQLMSFFPITVLLVCVSLKKPVTC